MDKTISRRHFLRSSAMATAGILAGAPLFGQASGMAAGMERTKKPAPSDRLNIAAIGIGGRGGGVLNGFKSQNIIGLCDVDWKYAAKKFNEFPDAKRYKDYRRMFDDLGKDIDAVIVATPDHTHAVIAAQALTMGKHVYCEKPMTHTVYETRLLTRLADKYQLATQMGNQGASGDGVRKVCEAIWTGMIGEVTKVEAFTDRPIWPQGLETPTKVETPHPDLDWDLFLGPAKKRPYNSIYHPWNWRGWWDFGTGALGDMACHILQPVVQALKLEYPIAVQGSSTELMTDCAPNAECVRFQFPARENLPKVAMPAVQVNWYDGGLLPEFPEGWPDGKSMNRSGGGVIFYGTKDILVCGSYGRDPWLISGREMPEPTMTREIPGGNHFMDFVRACKESPESRIKCASDFEYSGPLNEMVVMGVLAVRLQGLNRTLQWDGKNMKFTNIGRDETIRMKVKDGFTVHNGHPSFNHVYSDPINAEAFAKELIRHTYHNGYSLPDMPL